MGSSSFSTLYNSLVFFCSRYISKNRGKKLTNLLENLLTNNLNRRKDELVQALQEISVEDRKRQLENTTSELSDLEERISYGISVT